MFHQRSYGSRRLSRPTEDPSEMEPNDRVQGNTCVLVPQRMNRFSSPSSAGSRRSLDLEKNRVDGEDADPPVGHSILANRHHASIARRDNDSKEWRTPSPIDESGRGAAVPFLKRTTFFPEASHPQLCFCTTLHVVVVWQHDVEKYY